MAYFTTAEARKVKPLDNTTTYPDADIDAMRITVEEALEHACGVAFEPRTVTERFDGTGTTDLLARPRPTAVSSATVDGEAIDASSLLTYRDGRIYHSGKWTAGRGNVSITYTHGYATVPGRVKRAAILLTKRFLVDSPLSDRTTQITNEDGTEVLITAGVRGAVTDVPEVNAVIAQYKVGAAVG